MAKFATVAAHRPSFPSVSLIILAIITRKTKTLIKSLILDSKGSRFNWRTYIESQRSLSFFLNHQWKSLIYRRNRLHHKDLSSDLRIGIIQSIKKQHDWILMLKIADLSFTPRVHLPHEQHGKGLKFSNWSHKVWRLVKKFFTIVSPCTTVEICIWSYEILGPLAWEKRFLKAFQTSNGVSL